jgi:hypothetical protein
MALAGSALTVLAVTNDGGGSPTDVGYVPIGGVQPTPVIVTDADLQRARDVMLVDGRLVTITGDQAFELQNQRGDALPSGAKLLAADIVWAKPVDSAGPWLKLVCRKTVLQTFRAEWTSLRSVTVFVDLGAGTIVNFAPGLPAAELGAKLDRASAEPAKQPACPEGKNDD